ncbi:sensor histidine kinase [Pantoea dispersa]|uniref:sensor histidine kinase n=1 Tax=Pantoea dispersa TaxID=59814 RepID=UPI001479709D|nr:sensor histidine kinase [Pantoea dispersa]
MSKILIDTLPFDMSARVPLQLGRESISNSTTAISELIKNSYDADATKVQLKFDGLDKPIGTIVIQDDGSGMDLNTLVNSWLRIGTENKHEYGRSRNGRVLTGAKGLGRLGIDRLCKKMILYTKTKEMDHILQININWKDFEKKDISLSEIKHKIFKNSLPMTDRYGISFPDGHGTKIILLGTKDDWEGYILDDLRRELRLLVSPFNEMNDFSIEMSFGDGVSQSLDSSSILEFARWSIDAEIDSHNIIRATFKYNLDNSTFNIEDTSWANWIKSRGELASCGPIKFKFYHFLRDKTNSGTLDFNLKEIRSFLDANQGIRIYRDNFRVRPYGEPSGKGDWLDLGLRKVRNPQGISQGGWKVGPNQVIGAVFISRDTNAELNDQANREGIVENDAFFDMRAFILKIIEVFESFATSKAKESESSFSSERIIQDFKKESAKSSDIANLLKSKISNNTEATKDEKKKINSLLNDFIDVVDTHKARTLEVEKLIETLEFQKDTMANLASIGILSVCLGHESKQHAGLASNRAYLMKLMLQSRRKEIENLGMKNVFDDLDVIISSVKYIKSFATFALSTVKPDKTTRKKIDLKVIIQSVLEIFKMTLSKSEISLVLDINYNMSYQIRGFEIDWESIIINLLTNSIWALEDTVKGNRIIKISLMRMNDMIVMRFLDSGRGLESGTEKQIFDINYSTRKDAKGNNIGTGMGLSIVRTFVEEHSNGKILALASGELGGAEFIINVPFFNRED